MVFSQSFANLRHRFSHAKSLARGSLDHPASGDDLEALGGVEAFDDLHCPVTDLCQFAAQLRPGVAAVGKNVTQPGEGVAGGPIPRAAAGLRPAPRPHRPDNLPGVQPGARRACALRRCRGRRVREGGGGVQGPAGGALKTGRGTAPAGGPQNDYRATNPVHTTWMVRLST